MWWEWMKAVLSSAISAWKRGLEVLFFPRCWPVLRLALRGETLPKLGQAGQKQMRSDTGGKQSLPEPLQAHITKCSTPEVALFCEHPSCRDYWHGKREVCENAANECIFSTLVCLQKQAAQSVQCEWDLRAHMVISEYPVSTFLLNPFPANNYLS